MAKTRVLDDSEIRVRGIEALNKALGPAAALRFLSLVHRQPTDYVEISRRLYEGQTVEDIFAKPKSNGRNSILENNAESQKYHQLHGRTA